MAIADLRARRDPQHRRLIRLSGAGVDESGLLPEAFVAEEALGAPFRIALTLLSENASLELKPNLGARWALARLGGFAGCEAAN